MKKTLIAMGVAAVVAAPVAAQAGVEVYGQARASVDFVNNNDNTAGNEDSAISLSSNASRLGFKGDEDLGNGLSVLWQIEQELEIDTGKTFSGARDTFVGLSGGFGTVLAGKYDSPYKDSTDYMDIFKDTIADYNALMGTGFNNRPSNTIVYMSPDMNGFGASVAYAMADSSGDDDNLPMTTGDSDQDAYSLSGSYNNGPIFVTAAYESANAQGTGGDDASAWKLGGSYTIMDATTVGAIWESLDFGGAAGDRDAWYLNVAHKMGDTTLKGAIAMADEIGGITDTGASHFSIGVNQALSKSTEVYALYTVVSNDANVGYGLKSKSSPTSGEDMSAFSFGINHKFSSK